MNTALGKGVVAVIPLDSSDLFGEALALGLLALIWIEMALAKPDRLGRDLDQLVVLDISERALERHAERRGEAHRLVLGSGADIGELLALEHIDLEVVVTGVLADDHAAINLPSGLDHHRPAILKVPQRIGHGVAGIGRAQNAVAPPLDRALMRRVGVEQPVHDAGTARIGEELALIADQ